ncbi:MAG: cytochrome c [Gammaproteobacteria bacterium]|nr:cytochrome c [Gammaproteobacteria bacterium]
MATTRPEYVAHRVTIDRVRSAGTPPAPGPEPEAVARPATDSGAADFQRRCAECHGLQANGTDHGPPLVHRIYEPGHHSDDSFYRAVREGVRQHHWPFGDMPPVAGVPDEEIARIVTWVRGLQRANGIN